MKLPNSKTQNRPEYPQDKKWIEMQEDVLFIEVLVCFDLNYK